MNRERRYETRMFSIFGIGTTAHLSLLRRLGLGSKRRVFGVEVEHIAHVASTPDGLIGSHGVILLLNLGLLRIELGVMAAGWR